MTSKRRTRPGPDVAQAAQSPAGKTGPSKLAQIVDLLSRAEGASLAELVAATGWQAQSVRGALAGALKRKGHDVGSRKIDGVRRWRIGAPR